MYDVGFGDCFLLFVPTDEGEKKVLVDCGSIKAGTRPLREVVSALIRDVDAGAGPYIDLVIATHRHRDHVSGFADARWKQVEVGEVWMPWTEDPEDPVARRIREAQAGLARELELHAATLGAADPLGIAELALNALSNEAAMETLHHGFAGRPRRRFFPTPLPRESEFEPDPLPGVRAYVMGPSRDEKVIADMEPPKGTSFLRAAAASGSAQAAKPEPFPGWAVTTSRYATRFGSLALTPEDREAIRGIGEGWELIAAASLDNAVNGTSLMLLFRVGAAHLLFPGDAQWGTWNAALHNREWRELLKKTVFYKVGHHGSHNATPREFVTDVLQRDFWAMASVNPTERWKSIPREPLLEALRGKSSKVARSDEADRASATAYTHGDGYLEAAVPIT
jgi:beta-lactamase superfamily II metal-dependent hydrolase